MILIFTENVSYSARYVTRHLLKCKECFELFLETDFISFAYERLAGQTKIAILKNGEHLCFYDEIKSVWAHRSDIRILNPYGELSKQELQYVQRYQATQIEFIIHLLHSKKCLGRFGNLNFNKLVFIDKCLELNIPVPDTLVTDRKMHLDVFMEKQDEIIVKSMARNFHYCVKESEVEQIWQHGVTNLLDADKYGQIPPKFDLSLFQEKLDKKYELRVLYVAGTCFAQVIFSQRHAFSEVDYRLGLGGSEMRQCNFNLPSEISKKIETLMNALNLNIGCIDIVVTKDDEYVFLEVNPSGIFTDMMDNCNYDMHFEIAQFLMT